MHDRDFISWESFSPVLHPCDTVIRKGVDMPTEEELEQRINDQIDRDGLFLAIEDEEKAVCE